MSQEEEKEKPMGVLLTLTNEERLEMDVKLSELSKNVGRKVSTRELFTAFSRAFISNPENVLKAINL